MNSRTSFALLAVLTVIGTLTTSTVFAQQSQGLPHSCLGCTIEEIRELANKSLLEDIPISVWTDKTDYGHDEKIMVTGQVANIASGFPVTITVVSPLNNRVAIDQINVSDDGTFETQINTAGAMWKYDGTYTIKANYGSIEKTTNTKVELAGGIPYIPNYETPSTLCGETELEIVGQCVPFSITGGTVVDTRINTVDKSIVISINAENDGILTITPQKTIQDGIYLVFVDGEEWDDVEIVDNTVTVMFPVGAETIEIFGTFIIPEFGAIAAMILAVAIISIIAISARSRLSIIPRY